MKDRVRLLNIFFFTLFLVSLILIATIFLSGMYALFALGAYFLGNGGVANLVVGSFFLLGTVLSIFTLVKIIQALGEKKWFLDKKTRLQQLIYLGVLAYCFGVFIFTGSLLWEITHEKPPRFFPTDDEHATYMISKKNDFYYVVYDSQSDKNSHTFCTTENGERKCKDEVYNHIEAMVGESPRELESLLGKKVKVEGDFSYADKQCAVENCKDIGSGRRAVFDITTIESAE